MSTVQETERTMSSKPVWGMVASGESVSFDREWFSDQFSDHYAFSDFRERVVQEMGAMRREVEALQRKLDEKSEGDTKGVSDEKAKTLIQHYIMKRKGEGVNELSTLDFVADLSLPPEQVMHVLGSLRKHGVKQNE